VHVDDLGFTLVDHAKIGFKEDHFIMAYQAKQDIYVKEATNERWSVDIQGRNEHDVNSHDDSRVQYADNSSFSRHIPPMNEENDVHKVHATQNDHNVYLHNIFYILCLITYLFYRQTLSLRLPTTLRRRFCHPLPQNGHNLKQI